MHIADGFLPVGVCVAGYATTAILTGYALRHINQQDDPQAAIPKASLLAAAFFVASWIHIPIPPTSVHLLLNGLVGIILGFYAVPAILVALFFQAIMFGHGGITTLGVNATMMALPALVAHMIFQAHRFIGNGNRMSIAFLSFAGGLIAPLLSLGIFATLLTLVLSTALDPAAEKAAIITLVVAHIPVVFIEGIFTMLVVLFLFRVRPTMVPLPGA